MSEILQALSKVLEERKAEGNLDKSYVAQLHGKGLNKKSWRKLAKRRPRPSWRQKMPNVPATPTC